jgi:hypothetical protein
LVAQNPQSYYAQVQAIKDKQVDDTKADLHRSIKFTAETVLLNGKTIKLMAVYTTIMVV